MLLLTKLRPAERTTALLFVPAETTLPPDAIVTSCAACATTLLVAAALVLRSSPSIAMVPLSSLSVSLALNAKPVVGTVVVPVPSARPMVRFLMPASLVKVLARAIPVAAPFRSMLVATSYGCRFTLAVERLVIVALLKSMSLARRVSAPAPVFRLTELVNVIAPSV